MTNILFFDVETTGLSTNWYASKNQTEAWPRIVQIAWMMCDDQGTILSEYKTVIIPDGWTIPQEAVDVHGITPEYARLHGKPIRPILHKFADAINECDLIVAHNFIFDDSCAGSEFARAKIKNSLDKKKRFCTMKSTVKLCKIEGNYNKLKYPSLQELHHKLFNENFDDGHDAMADVKACAKVFFELKRLNVP